MSDNVLNQPSGRLMTSWERRWTAFQGICIRLRRKYVPHLIWYGQEVDIVITFKEDTLKPKDDEFAAFSRLFSGELRHAEVALERMGVNFDSGMGFDGRDWEWDWSLSGPISVRFKSKAKQPDRRLPHRAKLVIDNTKGCADG